MSKGLEALEKLSYENACCRCQYCIDKKCTNKHECIWLDIKKELRAFETIIDKVFDKESLSAYVDMCFEKCLITEEEYDLLKEVLS